MRILEIKLSNYRQYIDAVFQFPFRKENDLHVVLGRNTLGKTDLLNAITWCLYNEEPHLGMASKALPIVNLETIRCTDVDQTCIVEVEITIAIDNGVISVKRKSVFRKQNNNDHDISLLSSDFEVSTKIDDGNTKFYSNEKADEWVNRLFPESLREFFFFDGEQLTQFFISEKRLRLETPINEISQVGLLNKVADHLQAITVDLKRKSGKENPDLEPLIKQQELAKKSLELVEQEYRVCKLQISESEAIVKSHNEFLRGQENILDLEDKRKSFLLQQNEIQEKIDQKKTELRNFIREYSTYIYLFPKIKQTLQIIKEKEEQGRLPPNVDKNFLKDILNNSTCLVCLQELNENGRANITKMIDELEFSSGVANILVNVKSGLQVIVEKIEKFRKNEQILVDEMTEFETNRNNVITEYKKVENKLQNLNDKESIIKAINERKLHEDLIKGNLMKLGTLEERQKRAVDEFNKADEAYNQALLKNKNQERLRLTKEFVEKSKEIALLAKSELMGEMRSRIQKHMQDLFLDLTWSRDKYKEVTIDEAYSLGLIHKDGYEAIGSCSAAERALLALSFTIALHEVSGFGAPIVIDTPGANISDANRKFFANTLSLISKEKQIILLFTPSEYLDEIGPIFDNILCTKSELTTSDVGRSVTVRRL